MKDEITYEAKPVKRRLLAESLFENIGLIILLLAVIILLILLFTYANGNPNLTIGLSEVLTMILV